MSSQQSVDAHTSDSEITAILGPNVKPGTIIVTATNNDQHLFDAHYELDGRASIVGPLAFICDPGRSSINPENGSLVVAARPKTWFHPSIRARVAYETAESDIDRT